MSLRRCFQLLLAVVVASAALALGSVASAAPNPDYTAPAPAGVVIDNATPQPVRQRSGSAERVAAAPAAAPAAAGRQQLAITGSEVAQLAVLGGVLVAVGAGTLVLRRRGATA